MANDVASQAAATAGPIVFSIGLWIVIAITAIIIIVVIFMAWKNGYFMTKYPAQAIIFEEIGTGQPQLVISQARAINESDGKMSYQLKEDKSYPPAFAYPELFLTKDGKKALVATRLSKTEFHPIKYIGSEATVPDLTKYLTPEALQLFELNPNMKPFEKNGVWYMPASYTPGQLKPAFDQEAANVLANRLRVNAERNKPMSLWAQYAPYIMVFITLIGIGIFFYIIAGQLQTTSNHFVEASKAFAEGARVMAQATPAPNAPPFG